MKITDIEQLKGGTHAEYLRTHMMQALRDHAQGAGIEAPAQDTELTQDQVAVVREALIGDVQSSLSALYAVLATGDTLANQADVARDLLGSVFAANREFFGLVGTISILMRGYHIPPGEVRQSHIEQMRQNQEFEPDKGSEDEQFDRAVMVWSFENVTDPAWLERLNAEMPATLGVGPLLQHLRALSQHIGSTVLASYPPPVQIEVPQQKIIIPGLDGKPVSEIPVRRL